MYSSLGCQHTLHQEKNLFEPPIIPALTEAGFVRWQVIQVLLAPAEHVQYLQAAVKRFEIMNPGPGGPFPKSLPTQCLPTVPDAEIVQWHEGVGRRLQAEFSPRSRPTSRPSSARVDNRSPAAEREFNPLYARRRPHLQSPPFGASRRQSSSDTREERPPNSPHPLKNSRTFQRASVESDSSSSSASSDPKSSSRVPPPKIRTPQKSPRSYSATRSSHLSPEASPHNGAMGRRHSSHGLEPQSASTVTDRLSPQAFTQIDGRSRSGNGPSPTGTFIPSPSRAASTSMPQGKHRGHNKTVSNDRSGDPSWREKLTAYIGSTSDSSRRRNNSESRDMNRDSDKERHHRQSIRLGDGIDRPALDRRRASPKRMESVADHAHGRKLHKGYKVSEEDAGHHEY